MGIEFVYDRANDILLATARGLVTFAELESHINRESDARALGYREIFDAISATTDLTADEARTFVAHLRERMSRGPFGPTAVVTDSDVVYGMARMIQILSELSSGPLIGVFRRQDDARRWLMNMRAEPPPAP